MMFVIGHRGAAGLAPENTIEAMRAGVKAGADMIEFDIRLTHDNVPVIIHDASLLRTHRQRGSIAALTINELREKTQSNPVPTLAEVLDEFFGKIKLNIECKSKGSGVIALELVKQHAKDAKDWENVLFSSFHISELRAIREINNDAQLGLLHSKNPFSFVAHVNDLRLFGVGFYKYTVNPLALAIAKKRGLFTYAYTVNRTALARVLDREGIDAIVTNRPDLIQKHLKNNGQ